MTNQLFQKLKLLGEEVWMDFSLGASLDNPFQETVEGKYNL